MLEGLWPVLHTSLLVMSRVNKTEFAIFIALMWYLLPSDLIYYHDFKPIRSKLVEVDDVRNVSSPFEYAFKKNHQNV